ncbi:hypothetical protein Tco_1359317, partial [Tanacetum coccineum]
SQEVREERRSITHKLKRLYKVGRSASVVSSDEASLGDQEDASKQGRKTDDIDADEEITLFDETQGRFNDEEIFDMDTLTRDEVVTEQGVPDNKKDDVAQVNTAAIIVSTADTIPVSVASIIDVEITLAQALAEFKSAKPATVASTRPKAKELVIHEEEQATTPTVSSQQPSKAKIQDKEWNDIQAKIKADQLLAKRLQAKEQEELTIEERAKLFQQLLEKRRKFFAKKSAKEKRNRPPTRAQQRSIMSTYLKNMAGYKHNQLKIKSFSDIQKFETKEESSLKRAGDELEQEKVKKQKVDEDKETAELQSLMKVTPDEEEVAVDAIPLATKPPSIVDYKIIKEGKIGYFQIIRANGSSKRYSAFIQMLRSFDREDLETLWKLGRIVGIKRLLDDLRVTAAKLQAEFDEEVRLAREKAKKEQEANVALTEEWDNVQARIDADYKMAQQMQVEEQEKLAMRAQEKRNKSTTNTQKRKTMSTYLKNMAGYKHNQLKNKSFDDIQKLFDKAMKMVNTFVDMDTELVEASEEIAEGSKIRAEESSKTTGEDLQ